LRDHNHPTISFQSLIKWLRFGIGVKRWLLLLHGGIIIVGLGFAYALFKLFNVQTIPSIANSFSWLQLFISITIGFAIIGLSLLRLSSSILAPYRRHTPGNVVDVMVQHTQRKRGLKVVAIGGGTGLPNVLRGLKAYTSNITAVVTVADDGGSSGRLRRDMGVPPPGDLRNNIAALADDESLLTNLFQYRFESGDLEGHSFGNLFIAALASIVATQQNDNQNSLAEALTEVERVLNIQGRVLPATLDDVNLVASVRLTGSARLVTIRGESRISDIDGQIEQIALHPPEITAYPPSIDAIRQADLIVIGPGSLYTSILPNLLVRGIADALRATDAYKIYICNVATQPTETDGYTVADHVMALERHIGRGVFQAVIANGYYPSKNAGTHTRYVAPSPDNHEISQRYEIRYIDLTDDDRPWRHDPQKLAQAILSFSEQERLGVGFHVPVIENV